MSMEIKNNPLWQIISLENLGKLTQYQLKNHKKKLDIKSREEPEIIIDLETIEEITRHMKIGSKYGRLPRHLR